MLFFLLIDYFSICFFLDKRIKKQSLSQKYFDSRGTLEIASVILSAVILIVNLFFPASIMIYPCYLYFPLFFVNSVINHKTIATDLYDHTKENLPLVLICLFFMIVKTSSPILIVILLSIPQTALINSINIKNSENQEAKFIINFTGYSFLINFDMLQYSLTMLALNIIDDYFGIKYEAFSKSKFTISALIHVLFFAPLAIPLTSNLIVVTSVSLLTIAYNAFLQSKTEPDTEKTLNNFIKA